MKRTQTIGLAMLLCLGTASAFGQSEQKSLPDEQRELVADAISAFHRVAKHRDPERAREEFDPIQRRARNFSARVARLSIKQRRSLLAAGGSRSAWLRQKKSIVAATYREFNALDQQLARGRFVQLMTPFINWQKTMNEVSLPSLTVADRTAVSEGRSRGIQALRAKEWTKAETHYRKALAIDPRAPYCLLGLGTALQKQGKPAKARECLAKLPVFFERKAAAAHMTALTWIDQKKWNTALTLLDKAAALNDWRIEPVVHRDRARVFFALGKNDKAADAMLKAVNAQPFNQRAGLMLSELYARQDGEFAGVNSAILDLPIYGNPSQAQVVNVAARIGQVTNRLRLNPADRVARIQRVQLRLVECLNDPKGPNAVKAAMDGIRDCNAILARRPGSRSARMLRVVFREFLTEKPTAGVEDLIVLLDSRKDSRHIVTRLIRLLGNVAVIRDKVLNKRIINSLRNGGRQAIQRLKSEAARYGRLKKGAETTLEVALRMRVQPPAEKIRQLRFQIRFFDGLQKLMQHLERGLDNMLAQSKREFI